MKLIDVLLVEDHTLVREGLRLLIESFGDVQIVGEAKTGREAVRMTRDLRPEIVIMDIAMPLLNGLQATRQILKAFPTAKVLILSAHSDPMYVEEVVKIGAQGYLVKQSSGTILAHAIRELSKGKTYFTPAIAKQLKDDYRRAANGVGLRKTVDRKLTPRESELLQLLTEGHVNKQIAAELGISVKTVDKHRQHVMDKLDIHDMVGLTHFAIATGIVENSIQPTVIRNRARKLRKKRNSTPG
jgi:DNA-binding NarL/FixJ family response regulator